MYYISANYSIYTMSYFSHLLLINLCILSADYSIYMLHRMIIILNIYPSILLYFHLNSVSNQFWGNVINYINEFYCEKKC